MDASRTLSEVIPAQCTQRVRYARGRNWSMVLSLAVALPVSLVAWPHLGDAARGWQDLVVSGGRQPPLIRAPTEPIKIFPPADQADHAGDPVGPIIDGEQDGESTIMPAAEEPIVLVAPVVVPDREPASGATPIEPSAEEAQAEASLATRGREEGERLSAGGVANRPLRSQQALDAIVRKARVAKRPALPEPQALQQDARERREAETTSRSVWSYRIQLAALPTREAAQREWLAKQQAHAKALGHLQPVIERAETETQIFFRVQAGDFSDLQEAQVVCQELVQQGTPCVVTRR